MNPIPARPRHLSKFPVGGLWDFVEWEIEFGCEMYAGATLVGVSDGVDRRLPCPHCTGPVELERVLLLGKPPEKRWYVICPRVVVAKNEGGYATTGVCLDCILEAAKTL